ncbi:pyridoxal phosphate-dependent decarboxylase family protein [Bradyrhizobium sp. 6(2017)]|uniref:pyridoxal phosphate-dependent decarboxylase family protein n=1 Tax=Bradyrhizobium sp. 6(2017) TaxID=1197460 RepID=UPI0013E11A5F|nr:pyridoxal-dependent decarboxylase [Bradyrhizobium sp. 6(2017)]QIG95536.1 diaminobutyrate decarboxylase [Bradyrhizobium sp. 6(2017)]
MDNLCGLDGGSSVAPKAPSAGTEAFFSVRDFTVAAHQAVERLADMLSNDKVEGVRLQRPSDLMAKARSLMTAADLGRFEPRRFADILELYLETGIKVNSRGYMGRQFSSVMPVTAIFEMVSAMAPQPASYYEAGQLANIVDRLIEEAFGRLIGWPQGSFEMVTTSGASLANLTAVLVARNRHFSGSWKGGLVGDGSRRPAIAIGEDAHFSVARIAGIIGIGQDQVIRLQLNERRQICPRRAVATLDAAAAQRLDIFCLIASAGTTAIGANDPLPELAALAKRHGAWLHVDAAHNGAFLVSDELRPRLAGLELADSFCLDAHKTLFVPALCTLLFYREKGLAETAFPQKDSYVFDPFEDEMAAVQSGVKNFECTKRPAILNLWLAWSLYGRRAFADKLEQLVTMTGAAHDYFADQPDFFVPYRPESNILCFMHQPPGVSGGRLSGLQLELRDRVRAGGRYLLSKVDLDGWTMLRIVLMNHRIGLADIAGMAAEIRRHTRDILQHNPTPGGQERPLGLQSAE